MEMKAMFVAKVMSLMAGNFQMKKSVLSLKKGIKSTVLHS